MKEYTYIISSCDKYSFLWSDLRKFYDKYVDSSIEPVLLAQESYTEEFDTFITESQTSWAKTLVEFLESIETEYVFYMQDDYMPVENFNENIILELINFAKTYNASLVRYHGVSRAYDAMLTNIKTDLGTGKVYYLPASGEYITSLQSTLFKRDFLLNLAKQVNTPWEFEMAGTKLVASMNPYPNCFLIEEGDWYIEVCRQGKVLEIFEELKNKHLYDK